MQTVTNGFQLNPSALLETAFQAIADGEMQDLPFFQPQIPVRACGFQLFERQWVGTILTPWMLSLLVLPGPEQVWQPHAVGDKLALSLPCGSVRLISARRLATAWETVRLFWPISMYTVPSTVSRPFSVAAPVRSSWPIPMSATSRMRIGTPPRVAITMLLKTVFQ